jgi:hypothetical protein
MRKHVQVFPVLSGSTGPTRSDTQVGVGEEKETMRLSSSAAKGQKSKRTEASTFLAPTLAMAATPAHAAAAATAGCEAAPSHGRIGVRPGPGPAPSRLGFLAKPSSRWAAISLPPGPRRAAPAAAAARERVAGEEGPVWVELEPITSEQQLDRVLADAQQLDIPIVLLWYPHFPWIGLDCVCRAAAVRLVCNFSDRAIVFVSSCMIAGLADFVCWIIRQSLLKCKFSTLGE